MNPPLTIARLTPDPDGLDFAALQQAGLRDVQALAGNHWTDYNAHDPGVTILDQLCYALTDLAHRSALPHEDYLADADGAIDLDRLGLYLPQDILPSAPLTEDDWRRLLYDRVPQLDDVWLVERDGLTDIQLKLGDSPGANILAPAAVRRIFAAERALCQDIANVTVLHNREFRLAGDIEVRSMRDPSEVYADIIFQCALQVGSGLRLHSYEHAGGTTPALDELLTGPFTEHGLIRADERRRPHATISLLHLIGVIQRIEGVSKIHRLEVIGDDGLPVEREPLCLPTGDVPHIPLDQNHRGLNLHFMRKSDAELGERLEAADRSPDQNAAMSNTMLREAARTSLNKLIFGRRTMRERRASLEHLVCDPRGAGTALGNYYSIQHQFPAIYGINAYGVPASAPPEARAAARQLKAYLYVFEQVMANYVRGLANLGHLFSLQHSVRRTYFPQLVTDRMLPDIEALYTAAPQDIARQLDAISRSTDPHEERRDRVLDVMLALYGERYKQQVLRKFNVYFSTEREFRAWLLQNKRAFLANIASLSKQRGTGFRYDLPAWNTDNVSGAHRKIAILLGLHSLRRCRPLCAPLQRHGLRIVEHAEDGTATIEQLLERLRSPTALPVLRVPRSLLLPATPESEAVRPALTTTQKRLLRLLHMKSEGLHMVEHVLLRPRLAPSADHPAADDDFYPHQVSVVFPNWTVRFASPEFRKLAEETVTLNLPAHVLPHFYWISQDEMARFEAFYRIWLHRLGMAVATDTNALVPATDTQQALDAASLGLLRFLKAQPAGADARYQWV